MSKYWGHNRIQKLKGEKGSVTLFVLIAMIFFLTVGITVYIANVNSKQSQEKEISKIQYEYGKNNDLNTIYNEQVDKVQQKLLITVIDSVGNKYIEKTWTNKAPLTVEVNWPDGTSDANKVITVKDLDENVLYNKLTENEINKQKILSQSCILTTTLNGTTVSVKILVDTTAPTIKIDPDTGTYILADGETTRNIPTDGMVTVTDTQSGVAKKEYVWTTSTEQPQDGWTEYNDVQEIGNNSNLEKGTYYLHIKATDVAGNIGYACSKEFRVMTKEEAQLYIRIVPETEEWTKNDVNVNIYYDTIFKDNSIKRAGFGTTEEAAKSNASIITAQKVVATENGWVYAEANVDSGDCVSNQKQITNIDRTLPTISVSPESSVASKVTNITITAKDEGGSGLSSSIQYQYNLGTSKTEVPTGDFKTYENEKAFEIGTNLTGTYYLWVQEVKDNAQNTSESNGTKQGAYHVFGPYVFDNTAPEITASDITYGETLSVRLKDTITTVTGWTVTDKNEIPTSWEEINAQDITVTKSGLAAGTYYIWAKDSLGNVGSKTIKVNAKSLTGWEASLNPTSYIYDGTEKTPNVILKDGDTLLIKDIDYTVEYKDNINAGTATAIITGKGNYTGTTTVKFIINKKEIQKKSSDYNGTYDGNAHTITFNVTEPTSDCTVYYSMTELNQTNYTSGNTSLTDLTRTNAGTTTIYWYVHTTNSNYEDISGNNKITINKAEGSVTVKITGSNIAGNVLTANATTLSDGEKTYQWWYADSSTATSGEKIPGETNAKYTISSDYVGKYIGCTVNVAEGTNYNACSGSDITDSTNNGTEKVEEAHYSITSNNTTIYYVTLGDAVTDAIQGNTIKAETDYEDSSDVTINKNITFNTNGKTITRTKTTTISSGSTVEISGIGTLTTSSEINLITNAGTLNITHTGAISNTNTGAYSTISNTGTINKTGTGTISGAGTKYTISGGTLSISNGTISTSGSRAAEVSTVTVTGGTISSTCNEALLVRGEATISGGTIQKSGTKGGASFVYSGSRTATLAGGTIKVLTGSSSNAIYNSSTGTINVDGAIIEQQGSGHGGTNNSTGTINVKSGSIEGSDRGLNNASTGTINVTGGTVTGKTDGLGNGGAGTITVTGGTVKGTNNGIYDRAGGTVTVGDSSTALSTTTPEIIGETYRGVDTLNEATTFNFYSGVLKAPNSPAYVNSGTMNVRENYLPKTLDKDETTGLYSTILAKDISKLEGTLSPTSFTYDGTAKTPGVTVKNGDTVLTAGNDYTFVYSNNINAGTGTVTITGKGNYTGTKTATFTINKRTLTVKADAKTKTYGEANPSLTYTYSGEVSEQTPKFTGELTTSATTTSGVGSYDITQGTLALADNALFLASNYSISYTKSSLTVTKRTLEVKADAKTKTYGEANPSLTYTYSGEVSGQTPKFTGELTTSATATSGVGSYDITQGTLALADNSPFLANNYTLAYTKASLTINAKNASTFTVTLDPTSYTYDGAAKTPSVTVKDGDKVLTVGTDYTFVYSNNTNAGTGTVTITGKGNYTGTKTATFTINKRTLTVKADAKTKTYGEANPSLTYTYSGEVSGQTPKFTGELATSATATSGVGSYDITQGTLALADNSPFLASNYSISYTKASLTVNAKNASTFTVTLDPTSYTYDGTAKTPTATVKDGSTTLTVNTNYTVSYSNNTNAGTATVTVTGKGNYTGTITANFTINKRAITVTAGSTNKTYDGTALTLPSTGSVTSGSLVSGHTITVTNTGSITNAGSTTNTLSTVVIKSGTTDVTANYTITKANGTLTVNKKTLTLTLSATSGSVSYNGTGSFTVTPSGYVGSESGTLSVTSGNTTYVTVTGGNGSTAKNSTAITVDYKAIKYYSSTVNITVSIAATTNYNAVSKTYAVTITDTIAPTITVDNDTTYAKSQTAKITISDTGSGLATGTYTFKYVWATGVPASSAWNTITSTGNITVTTAGAVSVSTNLTKSDGTGQYKLYINTVTVIKDVAGNSLASGTGASGNQYLDNTAPTLSGWTKAVSTSKPSAYQSASYDVTLTITEAHSGMSGYYTTGDTSSTTAPTNWTSHTSNTLTITIAYGQTLRVWLKDKAGNTSYKDFKLSGDAVALSTETDSYVLYPTLQSAVNGTISGNITLLANIQEKVTNSRGSSITVTINLGSKTITNPSNSDTGYIFTNTNNSKLVLQGASSSSYAEIGGPHSVSSTKGIYNASGSTLTCTYVSVLSDSYALNSAGTTTLNYFSNVSIDNDYGVYISNGTTKITNSEISQSSGGGDTMRIGGSAAVTLGSGTTIDAGGGTGRAIYMDGSSTLSVQGGTITGPSMKSEDNALVAHHGSGKISISSGTLSSSLNTYVVYVDNTATMSITGGTITATGSNGTVALGSRSTATTPIAVSGGTIKSTAAAAVFGENTGSSTVNINLYGGTIISSKTNAVSISSSTSSLIKVNIGNTSTTYSTTAVTLISSVGYAVSGKSGNTNVTLGNGRIYAKNSTYYTNCSAYVRSGYTRTTTSGASITAGGTTYSSLYYNYLKAN